IIGRDRATWRGSVLRRWLNGYLLKSPIVIFGNLLESCRETSVSPNVPGVYERHGTEGDLSPSIQVLELLHQLLRIRKIAIGHQNDETRILLERKLNCGKGVGAAGGGHGVEKLDGGGLMRIVGGIAELPRAPRFAVRIGKEDHVKALGRAQLSDASF